MANETLTPMPDPVKVREAGEAVRKLPPALFLPRLLPVGWSLAERGQDGACYRHTGGLAVIISACVELDGKSWLHVSLSRARAIPNYEDVVTVKEVFIGTDKTAYQVFPPRAQHVNIHPNVLHLWHCLDGAVTPDFTHGTGSI